MSVDFERVKAVFQTAVTEHRPDEWDRYLDEACASDAGLRREVNDLLRAHHEGGSLLDRPALANGQQTIASLAEGPGTVIGAYKLLQQIGEGGMGVVFMAEQTEPIQRTVALKIIKPGMDTRQVIARFEAERQALAMMDHPNIAKVLDAGTTEADRPYFVMDLVKGVPITDYCDREHISVRQRLELMSQVCQAVQHAHQKGIIHRDLKPSNVLVAEYDGKAVPKIIDFGVAKATAQRLTERTMFTQYGQIVGTFEYMSPEQARFNQLDVDTRSDIYSLGVLLYELLAGSTPLEKERLRAAAFDEILRIISDEDPPRPSTRLSSSQSLPSIAANRNLEPRRLTGLISGELDWIVMKCLEKDRNRRFETASGLAADIERYLSDEQVLACPPSTSYRFRKFARRNKGTLLAASAVLAMLLSLVAGLTVSNVRVARERNQKAGALKEKEQALAAARASAERADVERRRAERNFLKARTAVTSILAKAATGQGEWSQLPSALRKVFSDQTAQYYQSLIQEGSDDPSARYETAVGYRSLGFLHSSAKEFENAEKYYLQSIQMLEALLTESGNDVEYRHQLAYSNSLLGSTLKATTRPGEAQGAYERAAELYAGLIAQAPSDTQYPSELQKCDTALLEIDGVQHPDNDVQQTRERAEAFFRERLRRTPNVAYAHRNLGRILLDRGKPEQAEPAYRNAIELDSKFVLAYLGLGTALSRQNKLDEAVTAYNKAIELDPKSALAYLSLSAVLCKQKKFGEAAAASRKAIELDPKFDGAYVNLGTALQGQKKFDEAAAAYRKVIELDPKDGSRYGHIGRPPSVSPQVAAYTSLGDLLREQRKFDESVGVYRELIQRDPRLTSGYLGLGFVLLEQAKKEEAIATFKKAFVMDPQYADGQNSVARQLATHSDTRLRDPSFALPLAKKAVELDPKNGAYVNTLGVACYRIGDWKGAIDSLEKSIKLRQGGKSSDWFFSAMAHWQLGDKDAARESYDRAIRWMEKNAPDNKELIRFRAEAAELLDVAQPQAPPDPQLKEN